MKEAGSGEAPVRSSPRLAAAAALSSSSSSGGDGSGGGAEDARTAAAAAHTSSSSSSSSRAALGVPLSSSSSAAAPAAARRSVSFGPASAEPPAGASKSTTTSDSSGYNGVLAASAAAAADPFSSSPPSASLREQQPAPASSGSASDMARSDSATRRARISAGPDTMTTGAPSSAVGRGEGSGSGGSGDTSLASIGMTPSSSSMGGQAASPAVLKPALKAGTQNRRLPPPGQYQHPDPLLRRLRLVDNQGQSVNLRDFFKGVKVVAFYFSSQWAGQPLKEYHATISDIAREHPNELRVVYVSVDVDEQWYKAGVQGQPWVSMVWNDGSSLPSPSVTNATSPSVPAEGHDGSAQPPPLYNSEDFLLAQELDIDESLAKTDTSGEAYLRPFSRVHLASKLNIIAAPTVCIYHMERQRMLDWNVRMARLHRSRRDETWARWRRGETAKRIGVLEALAQSPGRSFLLAFAIVYWIMILVGGQDWNFIRRALERADGSRGTNMMQDFAAKVGGGDGNGDHLNRHVEF